jgi:uncharacterized membrane protein YbaN (DUF454 family)
MPLCFNVLIQTQLCSVASCGKMLQDLQDHTCICNTTKLSAISTVSVQSHMCMKCHELYSIHIIMLMES